jgi:hypothetical protein
MTYPLKKNCVGKGRESRKEMEKRRKKGGNGKFAV